MGLKELKGEVTEEVAAILASGFSIDVVETTMVPHSSDGAITFPNLDDNKQGTKLIDTCVLYIDIRRSTQLNFAQRPKTVAKLYSAFVRAMTRSARYNKGHVRGIIGDRVMVIFDKKDCFQNAVNCAVTMNSVAKHVINKHFQHGEFECGIGIDAGKMLATKTGIRRRGNQQENYRSLVWLGRPANIASKLTDIANKPEDSFSYTMVRAAFTRSPMANALAGASGLGVLGSNLLAANDWEWKDIHPGNFVKQLDVQYVPPRLVHKDPAFQSMFTVEETYVRSPRTPPILITEAVWNGFRAACPTSNIITEPLFRPISVSVPAYKGKVYAGDLFYPIFKE